MKKILIILIIIFINTNSIFAKEVNVYTSRHYESDTELYKSFTKKTGIKVNIISGKAKALEKRIIEEDRYSKADLYIVSDAGRLYSIENKGFLQEIRSEVLESKIPKNFRTKSWFAIAKRARIIFYNPKKITLHEIKDLTYEELSKSKWKKKILIRKSNNIYNQSLVASLIENNGIEKTYEWAKGLVVNMARKPKGNDRAQILGVANEEAEIAIANTYYYALMLSGQKGEEQRKAAQKVKPFFPNQSDRGTHMNISGGGVLKYAPNKKNAIKLLEYFLSESAQKHIVNNTFEYPMLEEVKAHELVRNMSPNFIQDKTTQVSSYGKWQSEALKIMIKVGWE